jgi:hypothetical protein
MCQDENVDGSKVDDMIIKVLFDSVSVDDGRGKC